MTTSREGVNLAKMTEDDGGGRGSENPEFEMTSFVNAPYGIPQEIVDLIRKIYDGMITP